MRSQHSSNTKALDRAGTLKALKVQGMFRPRRLRRAGTGSRSVTGDCNRQPRGSGWWRRPPATPSGSAGRTGAGPPSISCPASRRMSRSPTSRMSSPSAMTRTASRPGAPLRGADPLSVGFFFAPLCLKCPLERYGSPVWSSPERNQEDCSAPAPTRVIKPSS